MKDQVRGFDSEKLDFGPMDQRCAKVICAWKYVPPYDVYNIPESEVGQQIDYMSNTANGFRTILRDGVLCGFLSIGKDAQVAGGDYRQPAIDVGMGLIPGVTGKGDGAWYVGKIVAYVKEVHSPERIRVTVAGFNKRAIRVWERNGFQMTQRFWGGRTKQAFMVLTRREAR